MSVFAVPASIVAPTSARSAFVSLEPVVRRRAEIAFRHLDEERREEASAEAVAAAFQSYVALMTKGRDPASFASRLANYAVLHVKDDRHVGGRRSSRDVLSSKAQARRGFRVVSLGFAEEHHEGLAAHLADDGQTPIPDIVSARIDVPVFLATLCERDRRLAMQLADGHQANRVAARAGLSPGRLTQLRRQWHQSWRDFIGEAV